jgi:hypothetical protein
MDTFTAFRRSLLSQRSDVSNKPVEIKAGIKWFKTMLAIKYDELINLYLIIFRKNFWLSESKQMFGPCHGSGR